jgi:hypothetical protein
MAFIAINAKADVTGSKKGKLTPAQNAMVNAWTLAKKTGIFEFGGKCEAVVEGISGDEFNVKFYNGFITICGRIVECETNTRIVIPKPTAGKELGHIIAGFYLGNNGEEEFRISTRQGATLPELRQEDLNLDPSDGVFEFSLYQYEATTSTLTLMTRNENLYIKDAQNTPAIGITLYEMTRDGNTVTYFNEVKNHKIMARREGQGGASQLVMIDPENNTYDEVGVHSAQVAQVARYASEDFSKGTIEQRLTDLGFKKGTVNGLDGGTLTRMGKYAILNLPSVDTNRASSKNINLYLSFAPAESFSLTIYGSPGGTGVLTFTEGSTDVTYRITGTSTNGRSVFPAQQIGYKVV